MSKVYCEGCKWFSDYGSKYSGECLHPSLRTKQDLDTAIRHYKPTVNYARCESVNVGNNCGRYIKKPWWMFWKG